MRADLSKYLKALMATPLMHETGRVLECNGLVIEAAGPDASLGELCHVHSGPDSILLCETVGFRDGRLLLMPYGSTQGVSRGSYVTRTGRMFDIPVGDRLLGRVVDAFCQPLDHAPLDLSGRSPRSPEPMNPLKRKPIDRTLETGVRAVDSLLTLGRGQRMGIFAGSGVGKSTLLGMLARNMSADVNIIALIGERGREVWDFIRGSLGEEGLKRSVVVVATADQPALVRTHAVYTATAIAESFRDAGNDVLLIMDSITRFAMAQREIGLAAGEPPTSRGYTPSVFAKLPQLLERCGNFEKGSITAIYSVLVEGDDMNEPITDHMRAVLDGHIVLSRELATRGHHPAIDVTRSISRLLPALAQRADVSLCRQVVEAVARVEDARDLIDMGAYHAGSNASLDAALARIDGINNVLRQAPDESTSRIDAIAALARIMAAHEGNAASKEAA